MRKGKKLMMSSALFLAVAGLLLLLLPREVEQLFGFNQQSLAAGGPLRLIGAVYMGMAVLNWTARTKDIRKRYGRPLGFGNLFHFGLAAATLMITFLVSHHVFAAVITLPYLYFTAWFTAALLRDQPSG